MTLADMSVILGSPVEVLARTKEVSLGQLSTPEYWLKWYQKTLAVTEETKRANRDFSKV